MGKKGGLNLTNAQRFNKDVKKITSRRLEK